MWVDIWILVHYSTSIITVWIWTSSNEAQTQALLAVNKLVSSLTIGLQFPAMGKSLQLFFNIWCCHVTGVTIQATFWQIFSFNAKMSSLMNFESTQHIYNPLSSEDSVYYAINPNNSRSGKIFIKRGCLNIFSFSFSYSFTLCGIVSSIVIAQFDGETYVKVPLLAHACGRFTLKGWCTWFTSCT